MKIRPRTGRGRLGRKLPRKTLVLITVLCLTVLGLMVPSSSAQKTGEEETCDSCHGPPDFEGDYVLLEPSFWIDAPPRVSPNETFRLTLMITHYGLFEIEDLKAVIDLSQADGIELDGESNPTKKIPKINGNAQTHGLSWYLFTADDAQSATIGLDIEYELFYEHNSVEDSDEEEYDQRLEHELVVKELPFELSTWKINAFLGKPQSYSIDISPNKDIHNMQVVPGRGVKDFTKVAPSKIGNLRDGNPMSITVTMVPDHELDKGDLVLIWSEDQDGQQMDSVKLDITVSKEVEEKKSGAESGYWLWGRVTGFLCFSILIILLFTGGTIKRVSKGMNRLFGSARKRIDLHCRLSYQLLILTLLHAALLMYGHYQSQVMNGIFVLAEPWTNYINLGTIALVLMLIISVNGIFQKGLMKIMSYKNWMRMHAWLNWATLGLVVLHMLLVGTTLGQPFRVLVGL